MALGDAKVRQNASALSETKNKTAPSTTNSELSKFYNKTPVENGLADLDPSAKVPTLPVLLVFLMPALPPGEVPSALFTTEKDSPNTLFPTVPLQEPTRVFLATNASK